MDIAYDLPNARAMTRLSPVMVMAQTAAFCTVIAVILWQFVPQIGQYGFWSSFVHSQAIGLSTAAIAMSSAKGLTRFGMSNPLLRVLTMCLATLLGLIVGMFIAARVLGIPSTAGAHLFNDNSLVASALTAVLASVAFNWYFHNQHKMLALELAASEQARMAEQARHAMLRAQLEPHMLFNTLANLRALIATDSDRALEMLDRLDSFLRESLASSQAHQHTLSHEFRILEDYLALIKVRFADRLSYTLSLPDNCTDIEVPSLLLQPLVENAIQHGIEPSLSGGHIAVSASCTGENIVLRVSDTGIGMHALPDIAEGAQRVRTTGGFGLASLRERLQQHYGPTARLSLQPVDTGTTLVVTLPAAPREFVT